MDGAQERLPAAEALKKKLELILEGEGFPDKDNPEKSYGYDIFVRWKPLEKQPIGWDPDLNDGVRLNIRPFMTVGDVKKKAREFCATSQISNGAKTAAKTWNPPPGIKCSTATALTTTT